MPVHLGPWIAVILVAAGLGIVLSSLLTAYFAVYPPRRLHWRPLYRNEGRFDTVSFQSADGFRLSGWFGRASGGPATIIVCHGWPSDRYEMAGLAEVLHGAGFNVLAFDFHGHGRSDRGPVTLGYREAEDVLGAVRFLREQHAEQARRIGIVGLSMGGVAAILAAARTPEIEAVVSDSSYARLDQVVRRVMRRYWGPLSPAAAPLAVWLGERLIGTALGSVSPIDAIARLSPRPVLIIQGTLDRLAGIEDAHALYRTSGDPKTLWLVEGAGHGEARRIETAEYDRRIVGFFHQYLGEAR